MKGTWPDWADGWDGSKNCPRCKTRLVIVYDYTGRKRSVCSDSGWDVEKCVTLENSQSGRADAS